MPLFEYACQACGRRFERFVVGQVKPACPDCDSQKVSKLLSVFAVSSGGARPEAESAGTACGSCGDPRGPGACALD